jgi:multiple sugar transport system permease protein
VDALPADDDLHDRADQDVAPLGPLRRGGVPIAATTTAVRPPRRDASTIVPRPLPAEVRRRRFLVEVGNHAVLVAVSAAFLLPFVFIALTSLMTDEQALTPEIWPDPFRPSNYLDVFQRLPLLRYTWNTFLIAGLSTVGVVLSCIPVAYALSRMRWRGRNVSFLLVLSTIMLPFQVTVIPLYILFVRFGWVGTMKPLVVPLFFGDAFTIFLLRQFFLTIPEELSDAARVDGAGDFQIMTRVIVPLAKPAIAAVALFQFLYAWNDFFAPLLYLSENPSAWTLSLALSEFRGQFHVQWNLTLAASVLFMAPVIVLFFLAQRAFVEGVTLTGVKG